MTRVENLAVPGAKRVVLRRFVDARGAFVKTFVHSLFARHGLPTQFAEEYHSVSRRGVLRGMHFQAPPHDHAKVVCCLAGVVLDAFVDLRVGSPTYRQAVTIRLDADEPTLLCLPPGVAHGFYTLSEQALVAYKVTSEHAPSHDLGVRWDSIGVEWPDRQPLVSPRDAAFPALDDYASPFRWSGQTHA